MALEPIFDDQAGNVIALLDERLVIQTRSVLLTTAALHVTNRFLLEHVWKPPFGILAVVNGDAGILPEDVRLVQREFVRRMLDGGAYMCAVVLGDTVHASTMRSMGRMLLLRQPRLAHFTDVASAAAQLAVPLSLAAADIVAAVDVVQRGGLPLLAEEAR